VSNTYPDTLLMFQAQWGGSVAVTKKRSGRHRTMFQWQVFGESAETLVRAVFHCLIEKQDQAEVLLKFRELRRGDRYAKQQLTDLISRLKRVDYGFEA